MIEGPEIRIVNRDDRRWWPIVVSVGASVLAAILAAALCLTVAARNAREERELRAALTAQFCALVVAFDDNYRDSPPATELGRENAEDVRAIRTGLCHSTG